MQARFTAVGTRPVGFRANQANAGTAGVVVDFPVVFEEGLDVVGGEKVRCAVRAVNYPNRPLVLDAGLKVLRQSCTCVSHRHGQLGLSGQSQYVAGAQGAAIVATELTECEGGF